MTTLPSKPQDKSIVRATSALSTSGSVSASVVWDDEQGASCDQLFFVTSYSDFDRLAHGPRGKTSRHPISVYRFHPSDGSLVLLNRIGSPDTTINPAFSRYHPFLNVVYTCTEDIEQNGVIFAYSILPNGELQQLGEPVDAGGTSTCYLTIDKDAKHMLAVNYWDSTLTVIPLDTTTGAITGPVKHMYDPKQGQKMMAAGRCKGGVNHSCNDESTIRMRQADPHSHALVLDPFVGTVAYVPDLGKDVIREFFYDRNLGKIDLELNVLPSGLCTGHPDGPRYLEFHPKYNIAYVVNELSSTVAVFEVDRQLLKEMSIASQAGVNMLQFQGRSTLRLVQSIKTLPSTFPTVMNTCGRICVHKSGRFVVVSNRGHESIAIFRVHQKKERRGELQAIGYFHTRGETPRHFQFDASGQYLLVANQDTDSVAVFSFNLSSGVITYTGNEYRVSSPNFICCCPMYDTEDINDTITTTTQEATITTSTVVMSDLHLVQPHHSVAHTKETSTTTSCDDDSSCVDVMAVDHHYHNKTNDDLQAELERARQEIAELKLLLQCKQNDQ